MPLSAKAKRLFVRSTRLRLKVCLLLTGVFFCVGASSGVSSAWAQAIPAQPNPIDVIQGFDAIATLWLVIAATFVFFMNAGFAMLEAGFCRTGNATNVLAKNLIVFCVSTFAFWLFGFRFMFGDSNSVLLGQMGFLVDFPFPSEALPNPFPTGFETLASRWPGRSFAALFFFQLVFAGTAATIVSGAIAERIKFWAFILFSFVLVGLIYPIAGYWVWGGGWLSTAPIQFRDFAGSTVIHSVGGIAALVGAVLIGPRQGKFGYSVQSNDYVEPEQPGRFEPHNMSLATLGCLILWLGWFGFNGGSTARLEYIPHILSTTFFSAAAGGVGAVIFSPFATDQKARLSSIINGILGGLVGITAASAYVGIGIAVVIGFTSSLLVLWAEKTLRYWRIDDPVGAIPVHLVCGGWGTLAVGLFASSDSSEYQLINYHRISQLLYQAMGWVSVCAVAGLLSLVAWIAVGTLLYQLSPESEKISKGQLEKLQANYSTAQTEAQTEIPSLAYLLFISRQGMRVPAVLEETGSSPSIVP